MNWLEICKDKNRRGLGIKDLSTINKALLGKWCWRFTLERDMLWRKLFFGKFGEELGGWCSWEGREGHVVGLWKLIRKVWGTFKVKTRFEEDNGRIVKFWHDVWCNDMPLKDSFPSLFTFAIAKEAEGTMVTWNPCFSRNFYDWELDVVNNLFLKLSEFGRVREKQDKMVWKVSKNGVFSIRSFYNVHWKIGVK